MWFSDDSNEDWWSTGYIIQRLGCGLISSADILLYLSLKDSKYSTHFTGAVVIDSSNNIDYNTYFDYISQMNIMYLMVPRWIGKLGPDIALGVNLYSADYKLGLSAKWCVSKEKMLPRITEMLDDDIPVTLGIYTSKDTGLDYYDLVPQANDKYNFVGYDKVNSHYVTITGMMIDNVKGQTMLEISTWGQKYFRP